MELVLENKNQRVFEEGNKQYTMLNMGDYVGHRQREWYEDAPEAWYLMAMEENGNKPGCYHIESLVDDLGDYLSIIMTKGKTKRFLQLRGSFVLEDSIDDTSKGKDVLGFGKKFIALNKDIYDSDQVRLTDYLFTEPRFVADDGEVFSGEIPSNEDIAEYLETNQILRDTIKSSKTLK